MDILEIDVTSFATRPAAIAAAELYGLLESGEPRAIPTWYCGDRAADPGVDLGLDIEGMASYVVRRSANGETLWNRNLIDGVALPIGADAAFAAQPRALQLAYNLFASSVEMISQALVRDQNEAERELEQRTRPQPPKPNIEDTIFAPVEPMGKLRPESVAASQAINDLNQAQTEAAGEAAGDEPQTGEFHSDDPADADTAAVGDDDRGDAVGDDVARDDDRPATPEPMSIGEPPAAPPVNKGGRGRKKQDPGQTPLTD